MRVNRIADVFWAFLVLGLTAFGGPIAHLGYFRDAFVTRRRWLDDESYGDLVALCQFLPGPTSSQVGFALGLMRAGWGGALAAWVGFTLPAALLMAGFAWLAVRLDGAAALGALNGLKIVAVAIVAQAVLGMARSLTPDAPRATIALGAVTILALLPAPFAMPLAIAAGAAAGLLLAPPAITARSSMPLVTARAGRLAAAALAILLIALPLIAPLHETLALIDRFFRAGALVFGGGHVVLPLLETELVPHIISEDAFLAGYGAVQAVPGPLFSFAAYLGALEMAGIGALIAVLAIFVPGVLVLIAVLPFWPALRSHPRAARMMSGANAAVVGVLGAALYTPVFTSAISDMLDFALALGGFVALVLWRLPPWLVVLGAASIGAMLAL
ncbi:chromate efflux transporter [Ketogulonicigenium vulgare]|uniref:chromate efflux transporter n=1 Tax=Ketogulonicigenium vulgare TaxID=92945 RepID=UPI0023592E2C|nr:chromate efflux transporter [Ketogulonicigenium vulgare]